MKGTVNENLFPPSGLYFKKIHAHMIEEKKTDVSRFTDGWLPNEYSPNVIMLNMQSFV